MFCQSKNLWKKLEIFKKNCKEQKFFFLYDDSNIIDHTFFTELNKRVQSYGLISLEFNKNNKEVVTQKNLRKFNIKHNMK